ncbi:MAG TPA: tryptophan synthase subunit alpha [Bacteroidales bacterium]|nr:tryptophan synthase subunit alpha [Bacteroidales bacterium]
MNRIDRLFNKKKGNILSVYFTAGYPLLNSTAGIITSLADAGTDMIEIGMPFSDPMADGPVIQHSNEIALQNGMNLKLLFNQLQDIRKETDIPILLMGYLNPVVQFGIEKFCQKCKVTGIDGVILPDLPPMVFVEEYLPLFEKYNLYNILLITPQSDDERIHAIDKISRGFIYMVSSSSVTGVKGSFSDEQFTYFKRVKDLNLNNPGLIGFGISSSVTFKNACKYSAGAIIGSAFVSILGERGDIDENIKQFVKEMRDFFL